MVRKPDVIFVGMPRSGTTWISRVLNEHKDIFIPSNKEINFFNRKFYYLGNPKLANPNRKRGLKWYFDFFKSAGKDKVAIDMSILTALDKSSARDIRKQIGDVKIVFCLRNPIDHIFSMYRLMYNEGEIKEKNFEEFVKNRKDLLEYSKYYNRLKAYFDEFPKKNVHIIYFDDLNSQKTFSKLQKFLKLKEIKFDLKKDKHASWDLKYPLLKRGLKGISRILNKMGLINVVRGFLNFTGLRRIADYVYNINLKELDEKEKMSSETKEFLKEYYKKDLEMIKKKLKLNIPVEWIKK